MIIVEFIEEICSLKKQKHVNYCGEALISLPWKQITQKICAL